MKTFFSLIAFFAITLSLFQGYKECKTASHQKKKKVLVSTKVQSFESSQLQENPVQTLINQSDSPQPVERKSKAISVPEMSIGLTALDALDAFQKAITEHPGAIENSDIIDTTVSNIRGYIAAEEEL